MTGRLYVRHTGVYRNFHWSCVRGRLAGKPEKELLQRVLFWAGVGAALLAPAYIFLGPNRFEQYDSIKGVALGIFALTLLVASKVYPA